MSSTNRGAQRAEYDYYATDPKEITKFLHAFYEDVGASMLNKILDPCAGGNVEPVVWNYRKGKYKTPSETYEAFAPRPEGAMLVKEPVVFRLPTMPMAYPKAIEEFSKDWLYKPTIYTNDIRDNSPAQHHLDFLNNDTGYFRDFGAVITNPPFSLAMEFLQRGLQCVNHGGYVALLLRLAFLESEDRSEFLRSHKPEFIYIHPKRMSFTPDGKTDSCAYAHIVWRRGYYPKKSLTDYLEY